MSYFCQLGTVFVPLKALEYFMRKMIIISLLSLHVIANTDLAQLFAVNDMIEHYRQHRLEDCNIGISAFICMHYGYDHKKDAAHNKLPFKSLKLHVPTQVILTHSAKIQVHVHKGIFLSAQSLITDEHFISTVFSNGLLRPPIV